MVITYRQFRQINGVGEKIETWLDDFKDKRSLDEFIEDEVGIVFSNKEGDIYFESEQEYTWFLLKWS